MNAVYTAARVTINDERKTGVVDVMNLKSFTSMTSRITGAPLTFELEVASSQCTQFLATLYITVRLSEDQIELDSGYLEY